MTNKAQIRGRLKTCVMLARQLKDARRCLQEDVLAFYSEEYTGINFGGIIETAIHDSENQAMSDIDASIKFEKSLVRRS